MDDDWVQGSAFWEFFRKSGGPLDDSAKRNLLEFLQAGLVRSTAKIAKLSDMHSDRQTIEVDWPVPPEIWLGDLKHSQFDIGGFISRSSGMGYRTVDLIGLKYSRADLTVAFGLSAVSNGRKDHSAVDLGNNRRSGAGAKVDAERWAMIAAAMAHLHATDGLDMSSANKAHKAIDEFLERKGHDNALGVDTIRSAIRRLKAWSGGHPFPGDADYKD